MALSKRNFLKKDGFDIEHSVPLMEGMLAACAAQCVPGTRLNWDTATQRFDNAEANAMIRPHLRSGWEF